MSKTIESISHTLRSLVSLAVLGMLVAGSWLAYSEFNKREQLDRLLKEANVEVERLAGENQRLDLALRLLKVDHRVANIDVISQVGEGADRKTTFQWVEVTEDGSPVEKPKQFTIAGDRLYVDALVIKYDDGAVETADPIRSTSVCLFQRLFGEYQKPSEGFPLDAQGSRPSVYSQGNYESTLEKDLWKNFWEYANNPEKQKQDRVRAAHGEAPNIRLEPGRHYRLDLRASGGLSIKVDDAKN